MTIDPDERQDTINAAAANYISGEWTRIRCEPVLRACGLNATQIEEFFSEHSEAAFAAMKSRASRHGKV